jgi:hypothetical protein
MQFQAALKGLETRSASERVGLIFGGYLAAFLLTSGVVWVYVFRTSGPDRQAYGAMYAFGDTLVFLAVFGLLSLVPTALALFFLRRARGFWVAASAVALLIAGTSVAALGLVAIGPRHASPGLNPWTAIAVPRIFVAPLLMAFFGLSTLLAPEARFRWLLGGATAIECVSSIYGLLRWFAPLFLH